MKRTLDESFRFLLYGVLGYTLERIINLIVMNQWFDNRVLFGPVQPMYAVGMIGAVWLTVWFQGKRFKWLFIVSLTYLITALSEWVSGTGYEALVGRRLWDYRLTFPACSGPYTCFLPTMTFALLAVVFATTLAPRLALYEQRVPRFIKGLLVSLFLIDIVITYGGLYAAR